MRTQWIITKDYYADEDRPLASNSNANPDLENSKYMAGPSKATLAAHDTPDLSPAEIKKRGVHFKMYTDDGDLYYTGYCTGRSFAPLDDFGAANVGCTIIKYRDENGKYEAL